MKIAMFFSRSKPRRREQSRLVEVTRDWTARDWADLPVHHPKKD